MLDKDKLNLAAQVLIVEDEAEHADVMAEALRKPGHVCTVVGGVAQAMEELRLGAFDVIVTDLRMPASGGVDGAAPDGADAGLRVLEAARRLQPAAEVVLVTAHGDVPTARAAFKLGAYDFIQKPLDLEVFRNLVNRAAQTVLLRHQNDRLKAELEQSGFEGLIAQSEPMRRVLRTVRTIAPSNLPVLITGESGTGKELIAQSVHRNSRRATGRYVTFNCAGQSESLLEDQLFGHVRGAFTGADKDRAGVFEYADGGTLFLDEIGDMPMAMQAKLLRVLESGEVIRLGSNEARHADVRFVSATNRDLKAMIAAGQFREDLYFRIKGAHVHIPALRERREDIPPLVLFAVDRFAADMAAKPADAVVPAVTDAAMMRLTGYDWPGNVRQLMNVVQNMVVMALGDERPHAQTPVIDLRHIPDDVRGDAADLPDDDSPTPHASLAGTSLEQIEKRAIRETLRLTGGNREQAAKLLGIGERTLYRKLKEYGLR
ncbi:MAG: sigma-54-dependent Fis family transcriptional regulator [Phycisphaeraceae bacterium]|nr:sigma-54-dependent Fis family transcriptional regulator [Phycisphaeraceae bacterium]